MASPTNLATTSIAAGGAGSILSAFSGISQGMAQSRMYRYQAGVAQINKQIALQNRDYALATGENEALRYGRKAGQERGATKAAQGASGIDVGTGTATDVRRGQEDAISMDLSTIRRNAARVAFGFESEAASQDSQSHLYGMAASNATTAGFMNATGSLISGAGTVSSRWLQASQMGIPGYTG